MSDMMKRMADLSAEERDELLALLADEDEDEGGDSGPVAREPGTRLPLSPAQETLWFLDRLAPGQPTYNVPLGFELTGPLDVAALTGAVSEVVTRHEALRTHLAEDDDGPVQVVTADLPATVEVRDIPAGTVEAELSRLAALPFDLQQPPLWRAHLLRTAPDRHYLLVTVHHVIFDGWSRGVFTADLAQAYSSRAQTTTPVQYPDYALWQRDRIAEEDGEYWKQQLAGLATLEFPTDRPRPAEMTYRGRLHLADIPRAEHDRLLATARDLGVTPYIAYVTAFFALLQRYTGQDDLVVGTPTANRNRPELEQTIGYFVSMLPIRLDAGGDPTLGELAGRVRAVLPGAVAHGSLPFDRIVDAVRPVRDPARSPLFQISFTYENAGDELHLPGLTVTRVPVDTGAARFDMSWFVLEHDDVVRVEVEYNTDLFDAESVAALTDDYAVLVAALAGDPGAGLAGVDLLDDAERDALLRRWNGPELPVPQTTAAAMFAERVAAAPDTVALIVAEEEVTYRELDRRSNQLARMLTSGGARPGELVALSLPRGVDLIVSILATIKSGAAYLPLDPGHPSARLEAILSDARPVVTITTSTTAGGLPAQAVPVIVLDDPGTRAALAGLDDATPACPAGPQDLAYAIYTSGSTGTPKGVLLEQHNLVSFITSVQQLFDLTPDDRVLGFASHTFDVSVFETFAALLTGARLHLATQDERLDIERLQRLLERAAITVVDLPPSLMGLLDPDRLPSLRIVFVGGEAFPAELVNRWAPGRRFFNGYGPTECTVTMIAHECSGTWTQSPPIAFPMANHVAHVLDRAGNLVPTGVAGELVIGGAGLARGYLHRPELTAEKFITDPFGTAPGGRLYHTGDLVKRERDGTLTFLGRIDQQVKIRGLRIELGEIEAQLNRLPAVAQSVVQPWQDERGEKQLVGYVVPATPDLDRAQIRAALGEHLPAYMVPASIVVLTELPLTTSGKVNRAALPAPEPAAAAPATPVTYADEVERSIAEDIVAPLLGLRQVDPFGDFFELGGHSLAAAQVVSRLRKAFGVEIALADFFRAPHVHALAERVREHQANSGDDELLRLIESMSDEEAARLLAAEEGAP
ncbi:non-ribosomal peptide synthetase [Actinoplanes sp. TFC3]|uniref:non-ribosomal peptide synthetase n=1 Tax=Actinoplanes sp. TFC3 TaxID=1710355 RepID=UPI00083499CE|nr:non-ribosomal peptide synthetase [Actinoplanes sp. TFC3]